MKIHRRSHITPNLAPGRDQVELAPDMGAVYGNIKKATGELFEIDLDAGTTYYFWTVIGTSCESLLTSDIRRL